MNRLGPIIILSLGYCLSANADIWTWVDADGAAHYASSDTPIWTWIDAAGLIHYSDRPGSDSAVKVAIVWYSSHDLPQQQQIQSQGTTARSQQPVRDETDEQRQEREAAEAYYCKEAQRVFETYTKAPRLYKTNANGEREFLSAEETVAKLAETQAKVAELCG